METPEQNKGHMWFTGNDKRRSNTDQVVQVQQVRTGRRQLKWKCSVSQSSDSILSEQSSSRRRRRLRQGEFYFYIIVLHSKSLILLWEQSDWIQNSHWTRDNKLIFKENWCVCVFLFFFNKLSFWLMCPELTVSILMHISQMLFIQKSSAKCLTEIQNNNRKKDSK